MFTFGIVMALVGAVVPMLTTALPLTLADVGTLFLAMNFAMLVVASRPVFHLPFKSLREVTDTRDVLASLHFTPRKQPTL